MAIDMQKLLLVVAAVGAGSLLAACTGTMTPSTGASTASVRNVWLCGSLWQG